MLASGKAHFIYDRVVPKARKQTGNLIAETAGGGATGSTGTVREYIYLPETEIAPTMGSRTVVDRPVAVVNAVNTFLFARCRRTPVIWPVSEGSQTKRVHVDHLNRPIRMTDAAKASVWDVVWAAPWFACCRRTGNVYSISGTATLDARFPGQWYQLESGLHYNWHRHYDPTLGRYTQPDPLGFVDGPSVYGYVGSRPIVVVDLTGLEPPTGERGATGGSSGQGTDNPYKHCKEDPNDPTYIICRDHQTGKKTRKKKPADWDEYKSKFCGPGCQSVVTQTVVAGGTIYIVYRCVRLIPSLVPSLWWTLPYNLGVQ